MPILPSNRKGLGAIIEGTKPSDTTPFDTLRLQFSVELPEEFSLEEFIPQVGGRPVILNQGATSSCVAHAFIAGIHIAESRAGLTFMPCSRLFAYYNARKEMGQIVVRDDGTYLRTCALGLMHLGVPDERFWPFSEFTLNVNRRPSFDAMRWAHPRAGGKFVKIYQRNYARVDAIKLALYSGHTVAFGTEVSENFLENRGAFHIAKDSGRLAGGHAMLIIGWQVSDGVTWFRVLNSWGPKWRNGGLCWFHQDLLSSDAADDFHIVYGWNRIQRAQEIL